MKKILIPIADGFEEIEAVTLIDVFRRAGFEVTAAGLRDIKVVGAHNLQVIADALFAEAESGTYDMIVLPGGQPGVDNLRADPRVLELLRRMNEAKIKIGAICAAPLILRDAGVIENVRYTSYPSFSAEFPKDNYISEDVVEDGHILTSRGPGTAMQFALKIVEILAGKSHSQAVSAALLAK